jgi:uncharacterized membrane protein
MAPFLEMLKKGRINIKAKNARSFKIPKKYIISFDADWKNKWDISVLVLAIYSGFVIPLAFSFEPFFVNHSGVYAMTYIIDFIFLVDLILGFFTTYINDKGHEEKDSLKIFYKYTR